MSLVLSLMCLVLSLTQIMAAFCILTKSPMVHGGSRRHGGHGAFERIGKDQTDRKKDRDSVHTKMKAVLKIGSLIKSQSRRADQNTDANEDQAGPKSSFRSTVFQSMSKMKGIAKSEKK